MFNRPIWRPYTQERVQQAPIHIERAQGSYLYTKSGQKIFDGISSWWLITHGHCHPAIVSALQEQSHKLDQVVFANFTHEMAEQLAQEIIQMTPAELTRVFLSDNGSTAVEVALKMALQACAQSDRPNKNKFLAFEGAYHGDTVGAMSVSSLSVYNKPYQSVLFDVSRVPHPMNSKATVEEFVGPFAQMLEMNHESVAGVIIEPLIQGASGMIVWPDEALRQIANLCKQFGVYLIFDEVMTGFGRTGRLFAMDRLGITPDLVCLSKGLTGGTLPLALTLVKEEIYQAFYSKDKSKMFFHGHSFTGNPLSCAAAVASLNLFKDSEYCQRWDAIARAQEQSIERAVRQLPVRDVRTCGTVAAIELEIPNGNYLSEFASKFMQKALERGVFVRPLGHVIYLMPPYCATSEEVEWAWDQMTQAACELL